MFLLGVGIALGNPEAEAEADATPQSEPEAEAEPQPDAEPQNYGYGSYISAMPGMGMGGSRPPFMAPAAPAWPGPGCGMVDQCCQVVLNRNIKFFRHSWAEG